MRWYVSPKNQGQIVEYAYAVCDAWVYRRITDRSDGSVTYAQSRALSDDRCDYWQSAPKNKRWRAVPQEQIDLLEANPDL
jgi:hypothetical protein